MAIVNGSGNVSNTSNTNNTATAALFLADGVLFIFRQILPFEGKDIKATYNEEDNTLYFHLGGNVIKLTRKIWRELKKHRTIFLYRLPEKEYDPDTMPVTIEIKEDAMLEIEKLWERVKGKSGGLQDKKSSA